MWTASPLLFAAFYRYFKVITTETKSAKKNKYEGGYNMKKIDPGPFSFLQPGWLALHAVVISGVTMLGKAWERRT